MDVEQLVIDAANRGIGLASSGDFMYEMTLNVVKLLGREFMGELRPGDRPSILLACSVDVDGGKDAPGAVLYLDDRIVVGWLKGAFRPKAELRVVPLGAINGVTAAPRAGNRLTGDRTVVSFRSPHGTTGLVLYAPKMHKRAVAMAEHLLTGAVSFSWGDDEPAEQAAPEPTP